VSVRGSSVPAVPARRGDLAALAAVPTGASALPADRLAAAEARIAALEARVSVAESARATAEAALELLRDHARRLGVLEDLLAGRVDEAVIDRAEAAALMGLSVRQFARLCTTEPGLIACETRPGGPRTHPKFIRRKLLAYRERRT
jgi:hypothetical protein